MQARMSRRENFAWQHLDKPLPTWFKVRRFKSGRTDRQLRRLRPCRNGRNFDWRFVELDEL